MPRKFERDAKEILDGLSSDDDSEAFEEAHRRLGELLGFEAGNSDADAAPDPWWIANGVLCLVGEDKNDLKPENSVAVKHTRQAASHIKWIRANVALKEGAEIRAVMITPATRIHPEVPTYAEDVGWWHLEDFRKWARDAIGVIRRVRSTFAGPGNVAWREKVRNELKKAKLDPKAIVAKATSHLLRDLEEE
jgi:hypothetical protein